MPDKFHGRKVNAVHIRCPHKTSGCEWVGEVRGVNQHTDSCPKRPWKCQHCEFTSTSDVGKDHVEKCTKYPVPCPNECEVGTVPHCDIEKHRAECPLEPVACEFADVGCNVKVARRHLSRHLEESQQQHLFSATLLNLRLTKAAIAEKDHQIAVKDQQLAEKDRQLVEKDKVIEKVTAESDKTVSERDHQLAEKERQLIEKDKIIAEKDKGVGKQLAEKDSQLFEKDKLIERVVAEKDKRMSEKDAIIAEKDKVIAEKDKQLLELQTEFQKFREGFMKSTKVALDRFLGVGAHKFTLTNFSKCQKNGVWGDWFSDPFYSHPGGYHLKLNVETRKMLSPHMKVRLYTVDTDNELDWPVTFIVTLQLFNQLGDHTHYSRELEIELQRPTQVNEHSDAHEYISFVTLYRKDKDVQYLVQDDLKLRMWITKMK